MDKKDKILIIIAPVAALTMGYVFFGNKIFPKEAAANASEDFTTIEAPVTEARKKRTELYRDKYEKENASKLKRNIQSDEFFFGEEIETDTTSTTQPDPEPETPNSKPETTNPEHITRNSKPQTPNKKSTPEVIIKYIDRPTPLDTTSNVVTQPKKIRRAGFVSQTSAAQTTPSPQSETVSEVNIPVVIQENIDVKNGSNIQLRTLEEAKINGVTIPKNTLVTGIVAITQERINVKVTSIKGATRTVQTKLNAYDLDGNEGMPVEGGVNKEIKKDVVGSAIQETGRIVNVPILNRLPTTSSGNKKINDPVIPVPKGYKLFLKPEAK